MTDVVPEVSLILCTRNRARGLSAALEAIGRITFARPWELVVVDNGSTDDTSSVVARFAAAAPMPVRTVMQPIKGLSNARNAGLAAARGQIIAFTDDDCYPSPDFLTAVDHSFSRNDSLGFVTGRIMLHDPEDCRVTINESLEPLVFAPGAYLAPGMVKGANLSFRRSALDAAGGFDPLFGSGALFPSEDVDTAARVSRLGWYGAYDPDIVVSHHHGRRNADIAALLQAYDIGRGAYHAKLLLHDRAYRAGMAGWVRLPLRMKSRPQSLLGELQGAVHYALKRKNP